MVFPWDLARLHSRSHTAMGKLLCATATGQPVLNGTGGLTCRRKSQRKQAATGSASPLLCQILFRSQNKAPCRGLPDLQPSDMCRCVNACFWYSVKSLMVRSFLGKDLANRASEINHGNIREAAQAVVSKAAAEEALATLSYPCTIFCTVPAQLFMGLCDQPGQGTDPAEE